MSVYSAAGQVGWLGSGTPAPVADMVAAAQRPWETPVRCHGSACTARATIRGFGLEAVYSRTELWVSGWKQRAGTRESYCPPCAVEAGLACAS